MNRNQWFKLSKSNPVKFEHRAGVTDNSINRFCRWIKYMVSTLLVMCCLPIHAATINFGPNGCTLQDAIRSANNDNDIGNCSAGSGHDVLISPDVWIITLNSTLPTISSDMTIRTATQSGVLQISGDNDHAVMRITGDTTDVTLERVFITEGQTNSVRGAGLRIEDSQVTINDSFFTFNRTTARFGGAIYIEDGTLEINQSFFEFNAANNGGVATAKGAAIYAEDSEVDIDQSRFTFNEAKSRVENVNGLPTYVDDGQGASVFMQGGELTVSDSLFSEPTSGIHGEQNTALIRNSTFNRTQVLNWEDQGGHVFFTDFSALTLNHVTMKSALRIQDSIFNMTNSILRGACNISSTTNWIVDAGNIYNTEIHTCPDTINLFYYPRLLNLNSNGGLTETFALQYNSDAINAGDPAFCLPTDQRGETRDVLCDIGAYEEVGFADVEVDGNFEQDAPYVHAQSVVYEAVVTNNSASLVNEIRIDVGTDHAVITDIDYAACPSFPCVLRGIQGFQEITIPVRMQLASFEDDFSVEITAERTTNSTYTDSDENNNQAVFTGIISDGADLAINMELSNPGNHFIGQVIKYQAVIENLGFDPTNDVVFEFVPTGLNMVSITGCNSVSGQVCQLGLFNNGTSKIVDIVAVLAQSEFDAIGEVSSLVYDIDTSNNKDLLGNNGALGETDISVAAAPLTMGPYYSLGYIEIDVAITTGSQSASNLRLWANFPESEFINCSVFINFDGFCEIPFIAANSTFNVTLEYFNPITTGSEQQFFPLTINVSPGELDTDLSDNEIIVNIPIDATSDVVAQLSLNAEPPYFSGQELEFDLKVINGGVNHASMLDIQLIPDNLTLVWESGNLCPSTPCTISQLERFNEENITLVYRIVDEGEFTLTATAQSDLVDLVPNNNFDVKMGMAELALNDVIFFDSFD